jgi:hypothetical protein
LAGLGIGLGFEVDFHLRRGGVQNRWGNVPLPGFPGRFHMFLSPAFVLAVHGKLLYPVKPPSDQQEFVAVNQMKLHVYLMAVQRSIQIE